MVESRRGGAVTRSDVSVNPQNIAVYISPCLGRKSSRVASESYISANFELLRHWLVVYTGAVLPDKATLARLVAMNTEMSIPSEIIVQF